MHAFIYLSTLARIVKMLIHVVLFLQHAPSSINIKSGHYLKSNMELGCV